MEVRNDFLIYIVDDDLAVRMALTRLLKAEGFAVQTFASAEEFLVQHDAATPGCLILDVMMPAMGGLELQQALLASGCQRHIVFISGDGSIVDTVEALKAGAVDLLVKPIHDEDILATDRRAIAKDDPARGEGL